MYVAFALQVCNDLLVRHGLQALGLCVEGHTSASIHGHAESLMISTKRSKRCEDSIVAHVRAANKKAVDAMWGHPIDQLVNHRGFVKHWSLATQK